MRIRLKHITPVLMAGAAAAAIASAPVAVAATSQSQQSCVTLGTSTKCQTPGDVEINSSIPAPPCGSLGDVWPVLGRRLDLRCTGCRFRFNGQLHHRVRGFASADGDHGE